MNPFSSTSQTLIKLNIGPKDVPPSDDHFKAMVNPSSITYQVSINYSEEEPEEPGSDGAEPKYKSTGPETMTFDLYLDGTGSIDAEAKTVDEQIQKFKEIAYDYQTEEHKPNDLTIAWGSFHFNCCLKTLTIEYSLFEPSGKPLRAKLALSFVGTMKPRETNAAGQSSPDLSHIITVKSGDTLPLLCQKIYKDSTLYTQIAKVNGLVNFRQLVPGSELVFPPIKK